MSCKRFEQELIEFAFGEAEPSSELRDHMTDCETCAHELAVYRTSATVLRALPAAPEPALSSDRLRQAILSRELRPGRPAWVARFGFAGAVAAAGLSLWIAVGRGPSDFDAPSSGHVAVAPVDEAADVGTGPIIIPEATPKLEVTPPRTIDNLVGGGEPKKASRPAARHGRRIRSVEREPRMEELMAVATGGLESAVDMSEAPASVTPSSASEVIVIQPAAGEAIERPSNDVSIGG
ncbi:MAG: anti-sigma factor family protein [Fimbriimonadales bacterium]